MKTDECLGKAFFGEAVEVITAAKIAFNASVSTVPRLASSSTVAPLICGRGASSTRIDIVSSSVRTSESVSSIEVAQIVALSEILRSWTFTRRRLPACLMLPSMMNSTPRASPAFTGSGCSLLKASIELVGRTVRLLTLLNRVIIASARPRPRKLWSVSPGGPRLMNLNGSTAMDRAASDLRMNEFDSASFFGEYLGARISDPAKYRSMSSASSAAEEYRSSGPLARAFITISSRPFFSVSRSLSVFVRRVFAGRSGSLLYRVSRVSSILNAALGNSGITSQTTRLTSCKARPAKL